MVQFIKFCDTIGFHHVTGLWSRTGVNVGYILISMGELNLAYKI